MKSLILFLVIVSGCLRGQSIFPPVGASSSSSGNTLCAAQTGSGSVTPDFTGCNNLTYTVTGPITTLNVPTGINSDNSVAQVTWVLSGGSYSITGVNVALIGWCPLTGLTTGQSTTQHFKLDNSGNLIGDSCVDGNGGAGTLATVANVQSGAYLYCAAGSSSATAYTCTITGLTAYTTGMEIPFKVDTACTGGVSTTLNINSLGVKNIYLANGSTNPTSGDCPASRQLALRYDGAAWRIIGGGAASGASSPSFFNTTTLQGVDDLCNPSAWTTGGVAVPFNDGCGISVSATNAGVQTAYAWANNTPVGTFNPTVSANQKHGFIVQASTNANADEYGIGFSASGSGAQIPDGANYSASNIHISYIQGTDTNWTLRSSAAFSNKTPVDTGVAFSTSGFLMYFRVGTAGTVFVCASAAADGTCNVSEVSMASGSGMANAQMWPSVTVRRGSSTTATITIKQISWTNTVSYP